MTRKRCQRCGQVPTRPASGHKMLITTYVGLRDLLTCGPCSFARADLAGRLNVRLFLLEREITA